MELEKTLTLPAPPERTWALLLDPQAMAQCVPGMQSVQVVSDDEYTAEMVTKVSFITARMKLRTRIVERDAPRYLKAEGTGEDSAVASSMKQTTEMHLEPLPDGQSLLRLKVKVDVVGRLATFGLSALKTKADRLWDEFGQNLVLHLQSRDNQIAASAAAITPGTATPPTQTSATQRPLPAPVSPPGHAPHAVPAVRVEQPPAREGRGWWQRLFGSSCDSVIVVEWHRPDGSQLRVQWPIQQAEACITWLEQLRKA